MTATEARRGLILLPIKCSCSAHAYNRGSIPTPIPDLPGIGGPSPSPSPIRRGSGVHSHPHPRFAGRGIGDHPHPRFPSGVPCPVLSRGHRLHEVRQCLVEGCRRGGCYVGVGVGSAVSSRLLLSGREQVRDNELSWVSASHRGRLISSMNASNSRPTPILNY
jgi:hypothetical protein